MITTKNYYSEINKLGIDTLPPVLQKSHELVEKATSGGTSWSMYDSNATIKKTIDMYIAKLNEFAAASKKSGTSKSASQQKVFVVRPGASQPAKKDKKSKGKKEYNIITLDSNGHQKKKEPASEQDVIDFANTVYHYDAQDSDEEPLNDIVNAMKALNDTDDYRVEKIKSTKNRQATKQTIEPKQASNVKKVERIDDAIVLIKRFINFHGKRKSYDQVMNLLKAVQKAILEKRVGKDSLYATEISYIQSRLIVLLNANTKVENFDIEISETTLEEYQDIVKSFAPMVSTSLLKRYVNLLGKKGIKEKVERLEKHFDRAFDKGYVLSNDKYIDAVKDAYGNIQHYLVGNIKMLEIEEAQLNGFRDFIKAGYNKIKPIAQKVAAASKHGYRVAKTSVKAAIEAGKNEHKKVAVKIKKLTEGAKAILNHKSDPRHSARVRVLKFFPDDQSYKVLFLTMPAGAGWSVGEEDTISAKYLVPGTKENLGAVPEMIAAAAGAFVQHHTKRALKGVEPEVMSVADAKKEEFEDLGLTGDLFTLIGKACAPTSFMFYGLGGSGKSGLALTLADVLNKKGNPVLYIAAEQFGTPSFVDLLNKTKVTGGPNFKIVKSLDTLPISDFKVIAIDSKDSIGLDNSDDFVALRNQYPDKIWIITSQGTKAGNFTGNGKWKNEVDCFVFCKNGVASTLDQKNRWGGKAEIKLY